jgi:replication factor C subunit 3/5
MIDHGEKIETLRKLGVEKKQLTHLLFYGPPGTGKTSLILALAREIYKEKYKKYCCEINASSERGIEIVRNTILKFITTASDKTKLVILDEADSMTPEAQNALRGVIDKHATRCRFCLICNNINKLTPAIKSRCSKMRFGNLDPDLIIKRIKEITELEGVKIEDEAIEEMVAYESDFRQLLNILQCAASLFEGTTITKQNIIEYLAIPSKDDMDKIIDTLLTKNFDESYSMLLDMYRENRWSIIDLLTHILDRIIIMESIDSEKRGFIIRELAEIEFRIKNSRESQILLAQLVCSFQCLHST